MASLDRPTIPGAGAGIVCLGCDRFNDQTLIVEPISRPFWDIRLFHIPEHSLAIIPPLHSHELSLGGCKIEAGNAVGGLELVPKVELQSL